MKLPSFILLLLGLFASLASAAIENLPNSTVPPINPRDLREMKEVWTKYYLPDEDVDIGWTGDYATNTPGTTSPLFRAAALRRLNLFRALVGSRSNTVIETSLNQYAQAAAVLMSINNAWSHYPTPEWKGWTKEAAYAAARSSLCFGSAGASAMNGYMDDYGDDNTRVGHRLAMLAPQREVFGFGDSARVDKYHAVNVLFLSGPISSMKRPETRDPYLAWPHPGYNLLPIILSKRVTIEALRWSFAYPDADMSAVTVEVRRNGKVLPTVVLTRLSFSFNDSAVVFNVFLDDSLNPYNSIFNASSDKDLFFPMEVTVRNIAVKGSLRTVTYTVTPFDPTKTTPSEIALAKNPSKIFVRAGLAFSHPFAAELAGATLEMSNLPAGVVFNRLTGELTGTLAAPGEYKALVELNNPSAPPASQSLTIVVTPNNVSPRLINLALRAETSPGADVATAGFVIEGRAKTVLVRLAGPALKKFGVEGALTAPKLLLFNRAGLMATSLAWSRNQDAAGLAQAASFVGGFPFAADSTDAAAIYTLEPGAYTIQASGVDESAGVGLIEIYDLDRSEGTFANLSTRAAVGTADKILVAGLTVEGAQSKRFLVRAIGPSLGRFGVEGYLADPVLTVFNSAGTSIASNDDWGTSSAVVEPASAQSGAFPLSAGGKDSALVITLAPGSYTVQVSGANGTTGVALAEIYSIP
jgi:hypothetical protein